MLDAASQHIVKDRGVIDNGQFNLRENLIDIIGVVPEKQIRMVFVELFHLLVVAVAAHQGVHFENQDITKMPSHRIVQLGISHVPEGRRMFANLTVYENLRMGAYTRKDKKEIEESLARVYERFPRLKERTRQLAGTLSGGEQQMLAMGRALMSNPRLLLLDEPSMGLSPLLVSEIFDIIESISKQGVTILLVEQNAKKALSIADRGYVLETGNIVMEDSAQALLNNEDIKKAYLGE